MVANRTSAGLLLFRRNHLGIEVFLVHPGGPFWANRDVGAWSVPKGEFVLGEEDALTAARREFTEETGHTVDGNFIPLNSVRQAGGKTVYAWALEADCDAENIHSNTYNVQWPPYSESWITVPEVDKAGWFAPAEARSKINKAQASFIDQLLGILGIEE